MPDYWVDGHRLKAGDKVYIPLPPPQRPPLWAVWRWPQYWRECRFARGRNGVYVVESVHSETTFEVGSGRPNRQLKD